jgi:uncharacterized phage protein (TIGR01671 family)
MQFTGLLDKNGKEIYEGDILTADFYPYMDEGVRNYLSIVEWEAPGFMGFKHLVNSTKRGISDGIGEYLEETEQFEVIGNIYENPELLSPHP